MDKLDFVKIKKKTRTPKFIIEKGKRHRWEIVFANRHCDKGLVSKIRNDTYDGTKNNPI